MAPVRKAVICDLYGTLIDAVIDEESAVFWDRFACDLAEMNCKMTGSGLKMAYRDLIRAELKHKEEGFLLDGVFTKLLSRCGLPVSTELVNAVGEAFRKRSLVQLTRKPYTEQIIGLLKKNGYAIGLLSNTEALVTRYDLKALGLQDCFDCVVLSSSCGAKKPAPRIFRETLASLGVAGDEAVFIGDTFDTDIAGCLGAGIDGIYLTENDTRSISKIEDEYHGHVVCSAFSASGIITALQKLHLTLH
jgi:putative hydrolase of the HAD superfamily